MTNRQANPYSAKALDFYCRFFGWKKTAEFDMGAMGAYRMFDTGQGEQSGFFAHQVA